MEKLYSDFVGRKSQIDLLAEIFNKDSSFKTPDLLFVYGDHGCGKTSVINEFFSLVSNHVNFAIVNSIECYTSKLLLESIVSQLFHDNITRSCTNIMMLCDYIKLFYRLSSEEAQHSKHIVIIIDSCDYVDDLGDEFMRAFSKLRQLTKVPTLSIIFISHLLPEKFSIDLSSSTLIYFPQYNKDDLIEILMKNKPAKYSQQFYSNYVKAALSIFYRVTRDLSEIKLMVSSNFTKYCEPIDKNVCSDEDTMALWRNIVPYLKASLNSALSGMGSTPGFSEKPQGCDAIGGPSVDSSGDSKLLPFDLPYFSKYFLIASYLASYNSTKHDKRLFLKNHGKKRKRKNDDKKESKDSISLQLLGPRMFPLDRLLAIFYSILDDHPNLTANLLSQISTLVELRLLIQLADGVLDRPTYKCMASYSCVDSVAKTVGFNISKYLIT